MANNNFDFPDNAPLLDDDKKVTKVWLQAMSRWNNAIQSMYQSGVTADRPTVLLWVGRRYFDTSLGKPVYLKSIRPNVWVDGVGTVS